MPPFTPFTIARLPEIRFGSGRITELPEQVARFARRALLVTGARSFRDSAHWSTLIMGLRERGIEFHQQIISDEPSPELIDHAVATHRSAEIGVVVAVGGGSVLDGAKAIAGLLPRGNSVMDHLEGVGRGEPYCGPALPFIAVPTTAGTGSEATKNAVLSVRGSDGFKKSFRDDALVARVALIDPELLSSCPRSLMAAQGMDAFTQLLESYVSLRSNPLTDALAWSGMSAFGDGFFAALEGDPRGRERVAYASLCSGICLAQTGLGSVHGLASPLGAFFPIPHGVVCGTLVAEASEINLRALSAREPHNPALPKYAQVGELLTGASFATASAAQAALVALLRKWTQQLELPKLAHYGMLSTDIPRVVANSRGSSMKTNPLLLSDEELAELLERRL